MTTRASVPVGHRGALSVKRGNPGGHAGVAAATKGATTQGTQSPNPPLKRKKVDGETNPETEPTGPREPRSEIKDPGDCDKGTNVVTNARRKEVRVSLGPEELEKSDLPR